MGTDQGDPDTQEVIDGGGQVFPQFGENNGYIDSHHDEEASNC